MITLFGVLITNLGLAPAFCSAMELLGIIFSPILELVEKIGL